MRFIAYLILAIATSARSQVTVQLLTGATNGSFVSDSTLSLGQVGPGSFSLSSGFTNKYQYFRTFTNVSYAYPNIFNVGGTNFTSSPTNWLTASVGDTNVNHYERIQLTVPVNSSGQNLTNGGVGMFWICNVTNTTSNNDNLDLLELDGGDYVVFQMVTHQNGNYVYVHCQNGGSTVNGASIGIIQNKIYWVTLFRNAVNGVGTLSLYDPANNFSLIGQSVATNSVNFDTWRFWLQANYLYQGFSSGSNWFSPPIYIWGTMTNFPVPSPTIFSASPFLKRGFQ